MTLERHTGEGYGWEKCAEVSYKISGNQMEIAVPKSVLGVENSRVNLEFKWMDNVISNDNPDIMDAFTREGDAAPGSRFNYVFKTTEDIAYPTVPDEGEGSGSSNESGKPESTPSTPQTPESGSSTGTDGTTSEESGNVQTGSMSTIGIIVAEVAPVVISGVTLLMICRRRKKSLNKVKYSDNTPLSNGWGRILLRTEMNNTLLFMNQNAMMGSIVTLEFEGGVFFAKGSGKEL